MARTKQKLHISKGATHARIQFEEAKHKRDISGKFADKPGVDSSPSGGGGGGSVTSASKADWHAAAKTSQVGNDDVIKLHVATNPKKPGSMSAERFGHYQDGMTVGDFKKAGGRPDDLAYDRKKGYVTFHSPDTYKKLSTAGASPVGEINTATATGRLGAIKASKELSTSPKASEYKPPEPSVPLKGSGEPPAPPSNVTPDGQVKAPDASKAKPGTTPAPKPETPPKATPEGAAPKHKDDEVITMSTGAKKTVGELKAGGKITDQNIDTYIKQGSWKKEGAAPESLPVPKSNSHNYTFDELTPIPPSKMADEGDKGLVWEYEKEYLKYGGVAWGPGIKDQMDFNQRYKDAPLTHLNAKELDNLGYTTINSKKLRSFDQVMGEIGHRRDPKAIRDRMFNGVTTPPIVLKKGDQLRLMAGQSRLFTAHASGLNVPVKIIDVTPGIKPVLPKPVELPPVAPPKPIAPKSPSPAAKPLSADVPLKDSEVINMGGGLNRTVHRLKLAGHDEASIHEKVDKGLWKRPESPVTAGALPKFKPPVLKGKITEDDVEWHGKVTPEFKKQFLKGMNALPEKFVRFASDLKKAKVWDKLDSVDDLSAGGKKDSKWALAYYNQKTKQSNFFEEKSKYDGAYGLHQKDKETANVIAHEFGHQIDFAGRHRPAEYWAMAKKVRERYITHAATIDQVEAKREMYYTSDTEMWARTTETVISPHARKRVLDDIIREEGLEDWMRSYYKSIGAI